MRKATMGLMIVLAGLAVFAWMQRPMPPATTAVAAPVDGNAVPEAPPARSAVGEARAPSTSAPDRRAPKAPLPLPPEGTPLAGIHDALAARARAGDNAAAMRLAFDLGRCRSRAGADDDTLREIDAAAPPADDAVLARMDAMARRKFENDVARAAVFCRGVAGEKVAARGEWLLLAAERGDGEAMVCFATAPNDFAPPLLSDAWFDWSRRWRERAPTFAEIAYTQGRVEILPILAEAYSGRMMGGVPISMYPLAAVIRADPVRAAAYHDIASRLGYGNPQTTAEQYALLDDSGRALARSLADRDVGKFTSPASGRVGFVPCRKLYAQMRADSM